MPEVNPAQVVIMGLVTVFIALICLIIIIVLLGKIMRGTQQLVAAIAAAIAEDMGEDVDHIKILSIRRV